MGETYSLKRNGDFRRLYRRGKSAVAPTLVVYAMRNRAGMNRLGLTAGKKVGCAAERNRTKRRLRALYRAHIIKGGLVPPNVTLDFVIVARAAAVDAEFPRLERDFVGAVKKTVEQICK